MFFKMFTKMDKSGDTLVHDAMIPGESLFVADTNFFQGKKFFEDDVFGCDEFGWC